MTLLWGTNHPDSDLYAGRVHVVWPGGLAFGLCGLPVSDVWQWRPPVPERLCPDCCIEATARLYPPLHN